MRPFITLLIILFYTVPAQTAEKDLSWQNGAWDNKGMAKTDDLELTFIGRRFLLGEGINQDIDTAELLFKNATKRNPNHSITIGAFYLNAGFDKVRGIKPISDALRWFEKARLLEQKEASPWLGLLFRGVAIQIVGARTHELPNLLAMAWFQAAAKYGDSKAKQEFDQYRRSYSKTQLKEITTKSQKILNDSVASYDLLSEIIIAPIINIEK